MSGAIDVHQHLWPVVFVDALQARTEPPYLRGWTLHTEHEPPYEVDPAAHEPGKRAARETDDGVVLAVAGPSSPLGIETHADLVEAWNTGATGLPEPYAAWAAVNLPEPDLDGLAARLDAGFLGVQVPADALRDPAGLGDVLELAQAKDRPVFVHPGPAASGADRPGWWAPVVDYTAQLQTAWWAWHAYGGREQFPRLRLLFAAAAGLAPVHHERLVARGGRLGTIDPNLYVDTSGYGPQAIDAVVRVLGIDQIVHGTDRPYADVTDLRQGDAAEVAVRRTNPHRLLFGTGDPARPTSTQTRQANPANSEGRQQ